MSIYIPYTYLIGWSSLNKYYYGVRFAKGCNPSDLWITYFTSSKIVKDFREKNGNPDIIEIRKTFNTKYSAILWESKVLRRINVRYNKHMLNTASISSHWSLNGGVPWNKGKTGIYSEETIKKISNSRIGKPTTKDRPNPLAAENARKGAQAQSKTVTGRKMMKREDGTRFWVYPDNIGPVRLYGGIHTARD